MGPGPCGQGEGGKKRDFLGRRKWMANKSDWFWPYLRNDIQNTLTCFVDSITADIPLKSAKASFVFA